MGEYMLDESVSSLKCKLTWSNNWLVSIGQVQQVKIDYQDVNR